jgi:hypothetical protein
MVNSTLGRGVFLCVVQGNSADYSGIPKLGAVACPRGPLLLALIFPISSVQIKLYNNVCDNNYFETRCSAQVRSRILLAIYSGN